MKRTRKKLCNHKTTLKKKLKLGNRIFAFCRKCGFYEIVTMLTLFIISGHSMAHLGYEEGMPVNTIYAPCNVGMNIAFRYEGVDYLKTLTKASADGSIWVEGRSDIWLENGKRKRSLDSRVYGWIAPQQYIIHGCVL